MGVTIDCGEGKHDLCTGTGTHHYLIPQLNDGEPFTCDCPCHTPTDKPTPDHKTPPKQDVTHMQTSDTNHVTTVASLTKALQSERESVGRLEEADEAASVAHDYIYGLNDVTQEQASAAIWKIHNILRAVGVSGGTPPPSEPPSVLTGEREPQQNLGGDGGPVAVAEVGARSDSFVLRLRWTCQSCGWTCTVDAPGFAGDGQFHYLWGTSPCGPITAQKVSSGTPTDSARLRRAAVDWQERALNAERSVGRLEEALRAAETELRFRASQIDDTPYTAVSLISLADEIAAALAGGTPPPGEQGEAEAGDAGGVRAEASEPSGGSVTAEVRAAIEACPTPVYHETHRYCPSCPWNEELAL